MGAGTLGRAGAGVRREQAGPAGVHACWWTPVALAAVPSSLAPSPPPLVASIVLGVVLIAFGVGARRLARRPGASRSPQPDAAKHRAEATRVKPTPDETARPPASSRLEPEPIATVGACDMTGVMTRTLAGSRRLAIAEAQLARELARLPLGSWMVEPYVRFNGGRIPFVVIGPTGLFVLAASDGRWSIEELAALARSGEELACGPPAFPCPSRAGICVVLDSSAPRSWYGGKPSQGRGGWVLGADVVLDWLHGFEPVPGLGLERIRALDRAAGPDWNQHRVTRLPAHRQFG